jgi:hypothetical protein
MSQSELGLETAPRSRGSLRSGAHLAAMRSQVRSLSPASAAPSGRRALATGRLAAQGELGLEAARKSRGSLAVRGRSRSHRVAGSIPAADGREGREESTRGWKRGESNEHRGHGRRAAGGGDLTGQTQRAPLRTSPLGRAAPGLSCWSCALPTIAAHGDARQSAHE